MFVYSAPRTGLDCSYGQTFDQKAVRPETDGTFTILRRFVVTGGRNEKAGEWIVSAINVNREDARKLAAYWIEGGFTIGNTKEYGLGTIEADIARRANRKAERARRGE